MEARNELPMLQPACPRALARTGDQKKQLHRARTGDPGPAMNEEFVTKRP
jgi:hypothetical protein